MSSVLGEFTTYAVEWENVSVERLIQAYHHELTDKDEVKERKKRRIGYKPLLNDIYQRDFVWCLQYQVALIVSLFKRYPIPVIYIDQNDRRVYDFLLDGRQRVETMWRFRNNKFAIPTRNGDFFFKNLPLVDQQRFLDTPLRTCVCKNWDKESIADLFIKLQNSKPLLDHQKVTAKGAEILGEFMRLPSVVGLMDLFHTKKFQLAKGVFKDIVICLAALVKSESFECLSNPVESADVVSAGAYPRERMDLFCRIVDSLNSFCSGFRDRARLGKVHILTLAAYFCQSEEEWTTQELAERGRIYSLRFLSNPQAQEKVILDGVPKDYINMVRMGNANGAENTKKRLALLRKLFHSDELPVVVSRVRPPVVQLSVPSTTLLDVPKKRTPKKPAKKLKSAHEQSTIPSFVGASSDKQITLMPLQNPAPM